MCVNKSLFLHLEWWPKFHFLGFPRGSGRKLRQSRGTAIFRLACTEQKSTEHKCTAEERKV